MSGCQARFTKSSAKKGVELLHILWFPLANAVKCPLPRHLLEHHQEKCEVTGILCFQQLVGKFQVFEGRHELTPR
uniref:Putative secreted protein n=1 Tax=Ixodes ricinus TaxID=34613 RepID=A0A6B0U3G9_IXORI